jgi:asparagine synthase (glutamine-hydrolysing)
MIHALRHRGPDGFGFYEDGELGLAHARLAIIDLTTGDQPICNEDRTIWTVFNGEIFNYVELRCALEQRGHVFRSSSDTETIVHAYEEYGDEFVSHLNGQFAIAVWDARARRLVLVRDRTGIRPLFYRQDQRRLLFGSEVKALAAVSAEPLSLDPRGLAQVFTFWATVGEQTVFQGVRSIPPGHMLTVDADGAFSLRRYWDWSYPPRGEERRVAYEEAVEETQA